MAISNQLYKHHIILNINLEMFREDNLLDSCIGLIKHHKTYKFQFMMDRKHRVRELEYVVMGLGKVKYINLLLKLMSCWNQDTSF